MLTKTFDPWLQTVTQLVQPIVKTEAHGSDTRRMIAIRHEAVHRTVAFKRSQDNARVYVRERLTDSTVVVDWSDPTVCNYVCQIWRISRAAIQGKCAVSGATIKRGEAVYRPIPLKPSPSNANAMIRASEIESALQRSADDGLGVLCHQTSRHAIR